MTDNSLFTPEEVTRLRRLLEIEAVREVRQNYSTYLDTLQIDKLADLYTENALCEFGPYGEWRGRETIRENYRGVMTGGGAALFNSMHHNTNHCVELVSATQATGRSYLIDVVTTAEKTEQPVLWYGVYDEAYEKVGDTWLIARCSLQFLWPERHLSQSFTNTFAET